MKTPNISQAFRIRPIKNSLYFLIIHVYAFSTYNIAQEHNSINHEIALLKIDIQLVFLEHFENTIQMLYVLNSILAVNQDIVKVYHHILPNKVL